MSILLYAKKVYFALQYWLDLISPEYNLKVQAVSFFGLSSKR